MTYTGLYLGNLHLTGTALAGYKVETIAEGTDFGNPVPVETLVQSLLQDGDLVVHTRDGNREASVRIILTGTAAQLQQGEADLMAELYKRNTLTVPALIAGGATTVYDIVTSSLAQIPDDLAEVKRNEWHYSVRLLMKPFGKSDAEVTVPALPASGSTTTLVNDGSSATNWSSTDGTPSVVSGAVQVATSALTGPQTVDLTYTASISTSATPYLEVDWKANAGAGAPSLRCFTGTTEHTPMGSAPSPTAGFTRSWFEVDAASIASVRFEVTTPGDPAALAGLVTPAVVRSLTVDNVNRTDIRPSVGTSRQQVRQFTVEGSARAPGSLLVSHDTDSLGDVLLYTWAEDGSLYNPCLSRYITTARTTDTSLVSGAYNDLSSPVVCDVPNSAFPAGALEEGHSFLLIGRIIASAATTSDDQAISTTVRTRINATDVGDELALSGSLADMTGNVRFKVLGKLQLPLNRVGDGTTALTRFTLQDTLADSHTFRLDELYLIDMTIGQLVMASCGTGTAASGGPSRRLFVRPADLSVPMPRVLRGHAEDGSDAFYAMTNGTTEEAWDEPEFPPGVVNVLSVTSNAESADVALAYTPHWHTHAGS